MEGGKVVVTSAGGGVPPTMSVVGVGVTGRATGSAVAIVAEDGAVV